MKLFKVVGFLILSLTAVGLFSCAVGARNIQSQNQTSQSSNFDLDLSVEKLAGEMSLTEAILKIQSKSLSEYLMGSKTLEKICPQSDVNSSLCQFIAQIEGSTVDRTHKNREHAIKLTEKNLKDSESMPYLKAVRSVSRVNKKTMLRWAPLLLKNESCPKNLSLASLRKIEENLPDKEVFDQMEAIYGQVAKCLKPEDMGYEGLHFRQALLRKLYGDVAGARTSLDLALQTTNPEERGRVLYWKGVWAEKSSEREKCWKELVEKQPMTYHSLMVWKTQERDPYKIFADRRETPVRRSTPLLEPKLKESIQWLEALYLNKQGRAAEKLTRWISANNESFPAGVILYLGTLKNLSDEHHNAILFLTDNIVKNPELITPQLLKELYPIPYLETFDRYSQGVDTFLVMGLARQESAFNPNARSPAKAEGLMQVLPKVARIKLQSRKRVNLYDSEINIRVGSRLLRDWIGQFGAVEYALIAYNAGPLRVNEWKLRYPTDDMALFLDLIPFKETRNYVGSILRNNYWYHRLYENDSSYKALRLQHPENEGNTYYSQIVRDMIASHKGL
jgi:soluble lytic murein transglycosylase-like protein